MSLFCGMPVGMVTNKPILDLNKTKTLLLHNLVVKSKRLDVVIFPLF